MHGTKRRRFIGGSKLKRCASLPAQKQRPCEINIHNVKTVPSATVDKLDSSVDSLGKNLFILFQFIYLVNY